MRVLITAVGQRTEHWTDLFAVLARQPDLSATVVVADVSPLTIAGLERCASLSPRLRFHVLPHVMGEGRSGHMASILIHPLALRRLDVDRPDVVHVIGEPAYLSTGQIVHWKRRRWPAVPLTHYAAQNVVTRFPPPFPWLEQRAYTAVDHMLPITPAALNVLRRKGYRGSATIIPLGVDTALFTPAPPPPVRPFTVGFVGRLEVHKGIEDLVQATEKLDCELVVVGRGSLDGLVRASASRRPGRVTMHDWVDHDRLPGLLAQMDALVLPSTELIQRNVLPWVGIPLREQFGRVLVEAMACGVPVVGSEMGEIPHVIGDAGLVFDPGDLVALVEQLARLRDEPALARDLRSRGIERATRLFAWEQVASSMREVWDGLCPGRPSGRPVAAEAMAPDPVGAPEAAGVAGTPAWVDE